MGIARSTMPKTQPRKPAAAPFAPFGAFTKKAIQKQRPATEKKEASTVCTFYKRGKCKNGADCKFQHIDKPAPPEPVPAVVQKLSNGVTALDLIVGEGESVRKGQQISLKFLVRAAGEKKAKPLDGTLQGDAPFTFVVGDKSRAYGQVVRGLDIGVVGMQVGGKRKLFVPYNMAYGEAGSNTGALRDFRTKKKVPPSTDVEYDLKLLEISAAPEVAPEQKEEVKATDPDELDEIDAPTGGAQFKENTAKLKRPKKLNKAQIKERYREHGFAMLENTR